MAARTLLTMTVIGFLAGPAAADWRADVLSEVKTGTTVKDAVWSNENALWIGVLDDGNRRDGFAQYACEVVKEKQPNTDRTVTVTVWDIAKMAGRQEMAELGKARCR